MTSISGLTSTVSLSLSSLSSGGGFSPVRSSKLAWNKVAKYFVLSPITGAKEMAVLTVEVVIHYFH